MFLRLDLSSSMSSISFLVLASLLSIISVAQSRPRERIHKGLYDDLKPVPFVDNPDEYGYMYGVYSDKRGKKDNPKHDAKNDNDPLEQYYDKYNKKHNRFIKGDGIVSKDVDVDDNKANAEDPDLTQLPVEGGVEDTKSKRLDKPQEEVTKNEKSKELITTPRTEPVVEDSKKKNDKGSSTGHRHGKHGKKNKGKKRSGKKSGKKSKKERTPTTTKPENNENYLGSVDQEPSNFNMNKFLKEHPDFKENIGTITDGADEAVTTTPADVKTTTEAVALQTTTHTDDSEDDDGDDDDMDDSDIDDDSDDEDTNDEDSESNDKSSEEYEFYDYYDEDGDSSYSSSEIAAENANYGTPYDWFKQYDKMFGDQPAADDSKNNEQKAETTTKSKAQEKEKAKAEPVVKTVEVTTKATPKEIEDKAEIKASETIPKTDIEPSTSPNPPTPQKDVKSTVTQPAIPQWKQKLNSWNYIESRPDVKF